MWKFLLCTLFLLKLRLSRSPNVIHYLRHKYNGQTLKLYRRLESTTKKLKKAELDHDFLLYCKMSHVTPNFIKFKLYRSSLYSSEFYRSSIESLLNIEINFKAQAIKRLKSSASTLFSSFFNGLSLLDKIYVKNLFNKNISKFVFDTSTIHNRKLLKLGLQKPRFLAPKDVIFNFSKYNLSKKEEFLLSLGLDFCLPNFKPRFPQFFLPFEIFFSNIRQLPSHLDLEKARQLIQNVAHKAFASYKAPSWFPFFKQEDFHMLRSLAKRDDLVICRPDKGRGVVLLDKDDYYNKMHNILSDNTKFREVGPPEFSMIYKIEDKINRNLKKLKDDDLLTDQTYRSLYCTGSSFGILYGLPKVHKENVPLRPILAAYNSPSFSISKFLVPLLNNLAKNEYTLLNSTQFIPEILQQNSKYFMVSYDVCSLFTNVPLAETIDIIIKELFPNPSCSFQGFNCASFKNLLELAVMDCHFLFNKKVYKQVDGMAMGSPLGPTFANIFMCYLEKKILDQCPSSFKPVFYRRYVDDTFVLFKEKHHAQMFLDFINSFHRNIKFTMDFELDDHLSFLDVSVSRKDNQFFTGVFRKKTFTGMGLNFFSHCSFAFKLNSCKTLLFRAFSLSSTWAKFHEEVSFLNNYFMQNCYPSHLFEKIVKNFLNRIFVPKAITYDVPKKLMYVSLPYSFSSDHVKRELTACLTKLYPYVKFHFVFKNPLTIGSLFKFKDSLPELMRSSTVYLYTCPKCNLGTYVGNSNRLLKVRISSHMGVSHRTGCSLSTKEFSAIRNHTHLCKTNIQYSHFKILSQSSSSRSLPFLESLYIKQLSPSLNNTVSSVPLHIA